MLYFEREIEGIEQAAEQNPKLAGRFIDLDKDKRLDVAARNLSERLKKEKIPARLSQGNIFRFKVRWDENVGVSLDTHREYVEEFGQRFFEEVKRLIDRNVARESRGGAGGGARSLEEEAMWQEVLDHARFCREKVAQFHGRNDLLDVVRLTVMKYLEPDSHNRCCFCTSLRRISSTRPTRVRLSSMVIPAAERQPSWQS